MFFVKFCSERRGDDDKYSQLTSWQRQVQSAHAQLTHAKNVYYKLLIVTNFIIHKIDSHYY